MHPLQDGLTPLWSAAKGAHAMVARELLTAGANKEARAKVRAVTVYTRNMVRAWVPPGLTLGGLTLPRDWSSDCAAWRCDPCLRKQWLALAQIICPDALYCTIPHSPCPCLYVVGPRFPQDGVTPLLWAAQHGTPDVVGVLVAAGADKEARDEVGAMGAGTFGGVDRLGKPQYSTSQRPSDMQQATFPT